jgi:hypothetical protein
MAARASYIRTISGAKNNPINKYFVENKIIVCLKRIKTNSKMIEMLINCINLLAGKYQMGVIEAKYRKNRICI